MAVSMLSGTQLVGAVALFIVARLSYELLLSPLKAFPGPFISKFTDLWRAYLTRRGNVDEDVKSWHRRYGSAVRVGPNAISLSDPTLIKTVYTTRNEWIKTDMYKPNDVVVAGQRISNIFNTANLEFHKKYTRPIGGFWTVAKALELEPLMDETLLKFFDTLSTRFVDGENAGKVCMMDDWVTYYAWDGAANVSFGKDYGFIEQGKDVGGIIQESTAGLKYFAPVSQAPWLDDWLDKNPVWRIGPRPLVNGFTYTVKMLADYRQQLAEGTYKPRDQATFMDKYDGLKKTHPDLVDDNQVQNWLMLNVLAGGDSTAGSMRAAVWFIVKHPAVKAKMVAELDAAKLSYPAKYKEILKLPYLGAVIRESMRMNPGVGLMLERYVPAGGLTLPDGRFVPAGTKVGLNPTVVTRDRGVFGDNVESFVPERWLAREGESETDHVARVRKMHEATDLMFGAGTRVCMGKHFARMELDKLVASLFSRFDVNVVRPDHEWTYCNSWFLYQTDMPMTLSRRTPA